MKASVDKDMVEAKLSSFCKTLNKKFEGTSCADVYYTENTDNASEVNVNTKDEAIQNHVSSNSVYKSNLPVIHAFERRLLPYEFQPIKGIIKIIM